MSALDLAEVDLRLCSCGCNRRVHRTTEWRHKNRVQPPPPKRRRTAHFQAESSVITFNKQKRTLTDSISSSSHSRVDASDHQLHAPSFDEFNPSLPLLDPPPAPDLLQPPGDALTEASGPFVRDFLLNLHTRKHRTTDQSDDEDSEGVVEGDVVEGLEAADHVDYGSGEDIAMEGDVDPREGIVSDWDLLAEEFIVEAAELGNFGHSLLHISRLTGFFIIRRVFYLGP
jgi:hypothetical protein